MAVKGAEILFLPHASPRGLAIDKHRSWMRHLTARAFDNSVFVVACNQTGYNGKGLTFPGNAVVLGHSLATSGRTVCSIIGYMPEDDAFISGMSAVRFVRMMGELSGLPPDAALERTHDALTFVGMGENRYRKVGSFSTGMKQMVKLAQALVHGPQLLL